MAYIRPVLMTVYSLELNRNAIREENPAFYLNFPETGSGRQDFNSFSLSEVLVLLCKALESRQSISQDFLQKLKVSQDFLSGFRAGTPLTGEYDAQPFPRHKP